MANSNVYIYMQSSAGIDLHAPPLASAETPRAFLLLNVQFPLTTRSCDHHRVVAQETVFEILFRGRPDDLILNMIIIIKTHISHNGITPHST